MTAWMRVTSEPSETKTNRGAVETRVQSSPYDVPIAVRGSLPQNRFVLIEFKYMDKDEPTTRVHKNDIDLLLGVHSHRLMAIEIPLKEGSGQREVAQSIRSDAVRGALTRIRIDSPDNSAKLNYEIVQKIVSSKGEDIAQGVSQS